MGYGSDTKEGAADFPGSVHQFKRPGAGLSKASVDSRFLDLLRDDDQPGVLDDGEVSDNLVGGALECLESPAIHRRSNLIHVRIQLSHIGTQLPLELRGSVIGHVSEGVQAVGRRKTRVRSRE